MPTPVGTDTFAPRIANRAAEKPHCNSTAGVLIVILFQVLPYLVTWWMSCNSTVADPEQKLREELANPEKRQAIWKLARKRVKHQAKIHKRRTGEKLTDDEIDALTDATLEEFEASEQSATCAYFTACAAAPVDLAADGDDDDEGDA